MCLTREIKQMIENLRKKKLKLFFLCLSLSLRILKGRLICVRLTWTGKKLMRNKVTDFKNEFYILCGLFNWRECNRNGWASLPFSLSLARLPIDHLLCFVSNSLNHVQLDVEYAFFSLYHCDTLIRVIETHLRF